MFILNAVPAECLDRHIQSYHQRAGGPFTRLLASEVHCVLKSHHVACEIEEDFRRTYAETEEQAHHKHISANFQLVPNQWQGRDWTNPLLEPINKTKAQPQ